MRTAFAMNLTQALGPAAISPIGALMALAVLMARHAVRGLAALR
jgi:hypothetical protein